MPQNSTTTDLADKFRDDNSTLQVGLKLEGVPADSSGQFGKQTVGDQKDCFACAMLDSEPEATTTDRALSAGGNTYRFPIYFKVALSFDQAQAINNSNVLKKLSYFEAVKLGGTKDHQVYYQIDLEGIQQASVRDNTLSIKEVESAKVSFKMPTGDSTLAAQKVVPLTPAK